MVCNDVCDYEFVCFVLGVREGKGGDWKMNKNAYGLRWFIYIE